MGRDDVRRLGGLGDDQAGDAVRRVLLGEGQRRRYAQQCEAELSGTRPDNTSASRGRATNDYL